MDFKSAYEMAKKVLDKNHYNLYKLVYERFMASQMADAKYELCQIDAVSGDYTFKASGRTVKFKGYTAVYDDYRLDDENENEENYSQENESQNQSKKE